MKGGPQNAISGIRMDGSWLVLAPFGKHGRRVVRHRPARGTPHAFVVEIVKLSLKKNLHFVGSNW